MERQKAYLPLIDNKTGI